MDIAPDRPEFFLGSPQEAFRRLRAEDPLHWYEPGPFWCLTKLADLQYVSRMPRIFSSARGTQIFEIPIRKSGEAVIDTGAQSIIRMDPPEHNVHRKLVIQAFTPRIIGALEGRVREIARRSLDAVPVGEVVDFIETVAVPMPMFVIAEMLGIPKQDYADFRRWSDAMVEAGGGGVTPQTVSTIGELQAYLAEHLEARRRAPRDDLLSTLLAAEIEGQKLTDPELLMFVLTLLVAGNETTRNLISVGTWTLLQHADQLRRLRTEPEWIPNAVEEMLRWVSPVQTFIRCATQDTTLRGKQIREGDYLVLFYGAANRDEEVFGEDANEFDITRVGANRHVAFGFGEHLCMGASLARLEGRVMFEELLSRLPEFELAGPVEQLPSVLMNGLVRMPVIFKA